MSSLGHSARRSEPLWSSHMVNDGRVNDHDPEKRRSCSWLQTSVERAASVLFLFFDVNASSARTLLSGTGDPWCFHAIYGVKVDQLVTGSREVAGA